MPVKNWRGEKHIARIKSSIADNMEVAVEHTVSNAKGYCPVDTGNLRN